MSTIDPVAWQKENEIRAGFLKFFLEAPNSKCFKLIYLKTDTSKMKRMGIY